MGSTTLEMVATVFFAVAILHTFSVKRFEMLAHRHPKGSVLENLLHTLAEVEVVFGLWAGIFFLVLLCTLGKELATAYLEGHLALSDTGEWFSTDAQARENATSFRVNYTEAAFVFVIMTMAATKPNLVLANKLIQTLAQRIKLPNSTSFFLVTLTLGPLLGSFITEPAAMTVTAMILYRRYYTYGISNRMMYATLGVLFVNISIGGTLTHFAAPPVLMVASKWAWGTDHMISHFGWKAAVAVLINTIGLTLYCRKELAAVGEKWIQQESRDGKARQEKMPVWITVLHLIFLATVVASAHHMAVFLGIFLFFLGVVTVTQEYQDELKLREALLVGFFLGGLVTLGTFQKWWLQPLLADLDAGFLYFGAAGLTAITDNAALTYLGSLVEGLSDTARYLLVAGAVAGGGLTVIANAPNPAGYGILRPAFKDGAISAVGLLIAAIPPTAVALACLGLLPDLW